MGYDGTLKFDTSVDTGGFQSGINKISSMAGSALKTTGAVIAGAGTAIAGLGAAAIKVGSEFEAGMSKVQAISNASADDMEKLTEKAKEMGAKTKFSAGESAEAFQYMAMAGWKTEDMLSGIEGVMNLAAASGEDLATTSDIVTDALTAFGLQAGDSGRFADVLAAASSNANTNVAMMGETFKYVAPVAGALGFSAEDCATAIGLMANSGIKASQAGTSLRSMFTRMAKPTKDVQVAMDKLKLSITNSDGSMKDLNTIMKDLRKGFSGLTEDQKTQMAATIGGQEAMSGLLAIVNASDEDFEKLSESIYNSEGAAERMAETMMDNLPGAIEQASGALETLGLSFYEKVQEPAKEVIQTMTSMVDQMNTAFTDDGFEGLIQSFGDNLAQLSQMAVEAAPDLVQAGIDLATSFINSIMAHSEEFAQAGADLAGTLASGLFSFAGEFWSAGVELLAEFLQGLASKSEEIGRSAAGMVSQISAAIQENLPTIVQAGKEIISGILKGMEEEFPGIASLLEGFFEGFAETAETLAEPVAEALAELFSSINEADPETMKSVGEAIGVIAAAITGLSVASKVIGPVKTLFSVLGTLKGGISGLSSVIGKVVEGFALWKGGAGTLSEVIALLFPKLGAIVTQISGIGSVLSGATIAVTNFVDMFVNGFSWVKEALMVVGTALAAVGAIILGAPAAVAGVVAAIIAAVGTLVVVVKEHWDQIVVFFQEASAKVGEIVGIIVAWFKQLPDQIGEAFKFVQKKITEWGSSAIKWISTNVPIIINTIVKFFSELPGKVWTWLSNTFQKLVEWGANMLQKSRETASDCVAKIVEFFSQLPGKVWTWLSNTFEKLKQWGANMASTARTKAGEAVQNISTKFGELPGKVWTWLSNTVQKVVQWGRNLAQKGRSAASQLVNAVVNGVSGLPSRMWSIGSDIVSGVWNGIQSAAGWFANSVYNFFSGLVNNAKSALGINSPSKVFAEEVGEWIPPGIGKGFKDRMPELSRDTEKDLKSYAKRMKQAVDIETGTIKVERKSKETYKIQQENGQSFEGSKVEVDISGEIHTHVELDGEEIGNASTQTIDRNFARIDEHKKRGG